MQLEPVLNTLRASIEGQQRLVGDDPAVGDAIAALSDALQPALRQAAMELAQQAAVEVAAQLDDRVVDVVLVDDDPTLRVSPAPTSADTSAEDFDARITLRLPPSLKSLIEDAATGDGDSVNSWVVDALHTRAKRSGGAKGGRVTEGFDL